jgi:hypothetical protein
MKHNRESIERALEHHLSDGTLKRWMRRDDDRYVVGLTSGEDVVGDLRAIHFLVLGLASAWHAKQPKVKPKPILGTEYSAVALTEPKWAQRLADEAKRTAEMG